MEEQPSRLKLFLRSPLFIIICGVFIVCVVIAILLLPKPQKPIDEDTLPAISVTNFSQYFPDLPNEYRLALEKKLYAQSAKDASSVNNATAIIRNDSFFSVDYNKYHAGDFIIDIKDLQISYLISFQYGSFANREVESIAFASIYCPTTEQLIYPSFYCSAQLNYARPSANDIKESESAELLLTNN